MGPFKCVECGVWWVGLEHRCSPPQTDTGTAPKGPWLPFVPAPYIPGGTSTIPGCTCYMKGRTLPEVVLCPVHDITTVTYTGWTA